MKLAQLVDDASPKKLAAYLLKLPKPKHSMHRHGGLAQTVRTADYKGHRIVIRSTYQVAVDERVMKVPLGVDNDGNVHCHSLPNYQFASAVGMVKQLIDSFPDEFNGRRGTRGGRGTGGVHTGMPSHSRSRRGARSKRGRTRGGRK